MEPKTFTQLVTNPGSTSTDSIPEMTSISAIASLEITSCDESSTSSSMKPNSISRPSTPTPTTPVVCYDAMRTPVKRVLSLDLEMRARKRMRDSSVEDDCIVYYSSPTSSLRLPNLIPTEDCCDSDIACLPDTSFLRQKKLLLRRRKRNVV